MRWVADAPRAPASVTIGQKQPPGSRTGGLLLLSLIASVLDFWPPGEFLLGARTLREQTWPRPQVESGADFIGDRLVHAGAVFRSPPVRRPTYETRHRCGINPVIDFILKRHANSIVWTTARWCGKCLIHASRRRSSMATAGIAQRHPGWRLTSLQATAALSGDRSTSPTATLAAVRWTRRCPDCRSTSAPTYYLRHGSRRDAEACASATLRCRRSPMRA